MQYLLRTLIVLPVAVLFCLPANCVYANTNRLALVIGNSTYENASLKNPANDATDMAVMLKRLGFKVTLKTNATRRTMQSAIKTFGKQLRDGGVGLFYYAGHGMQVRGYNYLIPIGTAIESESDVEYEAVDAGRVLGKMEDAGNGLNIIILDACRNNPYSRSFRSGSHGLAKMDAPTGSILSFSTAPGSVAADGRGRNGLYTSKLLKHMPTKGLGIEKMFKKVRIEVARASDKKQTPWESSSLMGDFYFNPSNQETSQSVRAISVQARQNTQGLNAEEEMWEFVKTSDSIDDYNVFLYEYPDSRFSDAARLKIQQLTRKSNAKSMTASIDPKTIDTGFQNDGKPGGSSYHMAIFPLNIYSSSGHNHYVDSSITQAISDIVSLSEDDNRIDLKYCYKEIEDVTTGVTITKDIVARKVWIKKSLFAKYEPNLEVIRTIGLDIGANLIVMLTGEIDANDGSFDCYLYDPENDKVYTKTVEAHWQIAGKNVKNVMHKLIGDFFTNQ